MRSFLATAGFLSAIAVVYATAAQTVVVTEQTCAELVEHSPDSDVAYKPGVDVHGRKVAPAHLGGGARIEAPKDFSIPITLDLQKRLGIPPDPSQYQTQNFEVGRVEYRDGRARFNGQPLQDEEQARLSRLCQERLDAER